MKLTKDYIGEYTFNNEIDITDPCYDRDVWCRMNNVSIIGGDYHCIAWRDKDRVMICGIYLDECPDDDEMEAIGSVGVDAGLCGFFNNKPDYDDETWTEMCHTIFNKDENGHYPDAWITKDGFFTSSGYGDGEYTVYVHKTPQGVDALEIRF